MTPMLLEVSPSFQAMVDRHMALNGEEITYMLLGGFADHLLNLFQQKQTSEFPEIAETIERFHLEGDDYVREAAVIGLLEGIQNVWVNNKVDPELFATHLLPESRKWWNELNAFWRGERRYVGEGFHSSR